MDALFEMFASVLWSFPKCFGFADGQALHIFSSTRSINIVWRNWLQNILYADRVTDWMISWVLDRK